MKFLNPCLISMSNKVRVGHYMPQYGTNTGTGQVLKKLVDLFRGHTFIDIVVFKYGKKFNVEIDGNITIVSYVAGKSHLFPPIKFLKSINKNEYSLDFLGLHMPFSPQNVITYFFSSIPVDYYPHGCFNPKTLKRKGKKIKKFIYLNLIELKILKNSRQIICVTERESSYINEIGSMDTIVAPFPFDFPILKNTYLEFRNKNNFSSSDFLIVFVGRFDIHTKGLDILVKAIKQISSINPKIKAALIGYNRDKPKELVQLIDKNKAGDCVFIIGPLYGEEKYDALLSSNLYVQASRYESFGVSILEPLSLKIPCLISDGCDISPSLYKVNGCYKFDGSTDSLVNSILKIYDNPSDSTIIGKNGFNWINDNLGSKALLTTWEKVFRKSNS